MIEWISVEKELPKNEDQVLVMFNDIPELLEYSDEDLLETYDIDDDWGKKSLMKELEPHFNILTYNSNTQKFVDGSNNSYIGITHWSYIKLPEEIFEQKKQVVERYLNLKKSKKKNKDKKEFIRMKKEYGW